MAEERAVNIFTRILLYVHQHRREPEPEKKTKFSILEADEPHGLDVETKWKDEMGSQAGKASWMAIHWIDWTGRWIGQKETVVGLDGYADRWIGRIGRIGQIGGLD